jgi:hypothetical protein
VARAHLPVVRRGKVRRRLTVKAAVKRAAAQIRAAGKIAEIVPVDLDFQTSQVNTIVIVHPGCTTNWCGGFVASRWSGGDARSLDNALKQLDSA